MKYKPTFFFERFSQEELNPVQRQTGDFVISKLMKFFIQNCRAFDLVI